MVSRKPQKLASVVGGNIRKKREALGMTQADLAEHLAVGDDSLSRIENGLVAPRFQRLEKIAGILDCSVADLFRTKGEPLSVKLDTLEDMLRPLPEELQEEFVCLMMNMARMLKKRA